MKNRKILVSLKTTCNIDPNNSVKIKVKIAAELDNYEDPNMELDILQFSARRSIQEQINQLLEAHGLPAKYSLEQRWGDEQVIEDLERLHQERKSWRKTANDKDEEDIIDEVI